MKTALFDYPLPEERVARHPLAERDAARLLVLRADGSEHRRVRELPELVPPNALVVLNETRVRRARLFGTKRGTGGRVELLLLRPVPGQAGLWEALGRASKSLGPGTQLEFSGVLADIVARDGARLVVEFSEGTDVERLCERSGHMPIPPYLRREAEASDAERYQTIFAQKEGSVAAPTAGLHFSARLMEELSSRGVRVARLCLTIGLDTFRPVTDENLEDHPMHSERIEVDEAVVDAVTRTRDEGGRVVAIGTTVVRALESAADPERPGHVRAQARDTTLFIKPGYQFRVVDSMFTNFHAPRSTLLALVSAFAGMERVMDAYRSALHEGYRFLSYGDAMWIPHPWARDEREECAG